MTISRIAVFCGSRTGHRPEYAEFAAEFGRQIARRGWGMVYGGGRVGLMGVCADAVLSAGGSVLGVIPTLLAKKEIAHEGLTELRLVRTMHERKAQMAESADAFVALPGGVGTLEEFFEIWTWAQIGEHAKPFGILNVLGFFDPLVHFLDHMVAEGFLRPHHRQLVTVSASAADLLDRLEASAS